MQNYLKFYGPSEIQYKTYMYESKYKEDVRMNFAKAALDYWFVHREALKKQSNLNLYLLLLEE